MKLLKADYNSLEFRICLWFAGVNPNEADGAFERLVDLSDGQFVEPAKRLNWTPRDISKSLIHGCVTGDHEVLTKVGWKKIEDWNGEEIATWYPDWSIKFEQPQKYHNYDFSGELCTFSGRAISIECTPEHNFPVIITGTSDGKTYAKLRKNTIAEFTRSAKIPVVGVLGSLGLEITDTELRRIVAVQADGSINAYGVGFNFVKERKIERINLLFGQGEWVEREKEPNNAFYSRVKTFDDKAMLSGKEKNFSWSLLQLSQEQREVFLDELPKWDGSYCNNTAVYMTTNKHNAVVVQALAHLSGREALLRVEQGKPTENGVERKPLYHISFNRRKLVSALNQVFGKKNFEGKVYCFTTNSGYFLVRHNDRISITGNSDYMEGVSVRSEGELNTPKTIGDRAAGALIVYDGQGEYPLWTYKGKIVCFTGVNLAERLFGDKTRVSRSKALKLQKIYLDAYPIRQFQMDLAKKIEASGDIRLPSGHRLPLYGRVEEDDLKQAAACLGQGGGHIYAAEGLLRFKTRGDVMLLHVYDEDLFEVPEDKSDDWYRDFLRPMVEPSKYLTGFTCPAKAKIGDNWQMMRDLGTIRYEDTSK